ncbi:carboxymuconolactone decarboxylase family protein [soil metagenome]
MQKITAIKHETAEGKAKELLDGVKAKLGFVPNLMATMASSPAVLESYLNFSGTLGTTLNAKLREQIALTVAEINGCGYCASAHSAIGKMSGLDETAILNARRAASDDAKIDAALKFASALVISRGKVSDAEFEAVKNAGYKEKEISEIVANVALNIFTNYFNETAKTVVDFPAIEFPLVSKATA